MRDGFPRAPSGSPGRVGVALSISDSQQGFSASDMGSRFSLRATDAHKPESLLVSELSQRVFLAAGHRQASRTSREACSLIHIWQNIYAHDKWPTRCTDRGHWSI